MRFHATRSRSRSSNPYVSPDGLLVLSGYGVRVSVERGHLAFEDGFAAGRRSGRLSRATAGLQRLVILGHSGSITFDAMRWLNDIGAAVVHIDADANLINASVKRGLNDARLRRAQALAVENGVGIAIGRELMRKKLEGQAQLLRDEKRAPDAVRLIEQCLRELPGAHDAAQLRTVEAAGAIAYWSALTDVQVRFARRDIDRVPVHWTTFGARRSPLGSGNMNAANPANAILNYLYAILEAESRIALLTMGLDAGLGIVHMDTPARDSLACDLMEPPRPQVDRMLLELLASRVFSRSDFFETRAGVCRLVAPLPELLTSYADPIRRIVAPMAEQLATDLMHSRRSTVQRDRIPTLLTQNRRSEARPTNQVSSTARQIRAQKKVRGCLECGVVLAERKRDYCDECLVVYEERHRRDYAQSGPKALKQLRETGRDPAHGRAAAAKRGATTAARMKANQLWDGRHGESLDPERFKRKILPQIQGVPLKELRRRTGLSLRYCSLIRRGEQVPHRRHWEALRNLGT